MAMLDISIRVGTARKVVQVESDNVPLDTYRRALIIGLKTFLQRGRSRLGPHPNPKEVFKLVEENRRKYM